MCILSPRVQAVILELELSPQKEGEEEKTSMERGQRPGGLQHDVKYWIKPGVQHKR